MLRTVTARLRRLFSGWALVGWLPLAWKIISTLSTIDWIRGLGSARWLALKHLALTHLTPTISGNWALVFGFAWLTAVIVWPTRGRDQVHAVRVFWNDCGSETCRAMSSLLHAVRSAMRVEESPHYWVGLIHAPFELDRLIADMDRSLADSGARPEIVLGRLARACTQYAECAKWVVALRDREGFDLSQEPHAGNLAVWKSWNATFREGLGALFERPEMRDYASQDLPNGSGADLGFRRALAAGNCPEIPLNEGTRQLAFPSKLLSQRAE